MSIGDAKIVIVDGKRTRIGQGNIKKYIRDKNKGTLRVN